MKSYLKYFVLFISLNLIEGAYRCDYKYNEPAKGWFKYFVVPATWADARLRCTLEGAVLASPTTPEIQKGLTDIIIDANRLKSPEIEPEIFTGIHATLTQGDYHTVEGTPLAMIPTPWGPDEPDNQNNTESCITLNGHGELADRSCEETRPYVCYRPRPDSKQEINECGTVDPEYRLNNRTNKCYKFHIVPRIYSRAALACTAEGGHLAIINSNLEAKVLVDIFSEIPRSGMMGVGHFEIGKEVAFIGFYDWGERGDWRTIHGQSLWEAGYSKFSYGEPSNSEFGEFCGSMDRSGNLNDLWCDKAFTFICEKSPYYPDICHADEREKREEPKRKTKKYLPL